MFGRKSKEIEKEDFESLLTLAIEGDEKSLGRIFDAYFNMTYSYVYKRVEDTEVAENIASEIWEKVYFHMKNMKQRDMLYFRNWLMKTTKNKLIDYYRKKKEDIQTIENHVYVSDQENPLTDLLKNEDMQRIQELMNTLSEKQSICINMKYFHGMKNKEIALKLDTGETTIASSLKRGLYKLRLGLKE